MSKSSESSSGFETRLSIYRVESEEAAKDREMTDGGIITNYLPPFYQTIEDARLGLADKLGNRQGDSGTFYISVLLSSALYPEIHAGLVNTQRIRRNGLLYRNDLKHFSVPVLEKYAFSRDRNPSEATENDVEVKVIKRREGYRPRVLIGTQDEMKDLVTRPAHASKDSFRSFLAKIHPNQAKPEDEKMMKLANDLFQYFNFI